MSAKEEIEKYRKIVQGFHGWWVLTKTISGKWKPQYWFATKKEAEDYVYNTDIITA